MNTPTVEQSINQLAKALQESKGWMPLFTTPQPCPRCSELEQAQSVCVLCAQKIDEAAGVDVAAKNRLISGLQAKVAELDADRLQQIDLKNQFMRELNDKESELTRAESVIEKCKEYAEMTAEDFPVSTRNLLTTIKGYQEGKKS